MSKVYGKAESYEPIVKSDGTRILVKYGKEETSDPKYVTWQQLTYYTRIVPTPTLATIKQDIRDDINASTDNRILNGLTWKGMPIWLSVENQMNYKNAYDLARDSNGAILPITFKFGTDTQPIFYDFKELSDLGDFIGACLDHIQTCLNDGWKAQAAININDYIEPLEAATGIKYDPIENIDPVFITDGSPLASEEKTVDSSAAE